MFFRDGATIHLRGWRLMVARGVWTTIVVTTYSLFILALPARWEQLLLTTPVGNDWNAQLAAYEAVLLVRLGIPIEAYALYFIVLECLFLLAFSGIGLMIFWRKTDEPLALFASLTLIVFGAIIPSTIRALDVPGSILETPVHALQAFGWSSFFICFYLFPDGQFVPRITRFAAPIFLTYSFLSLFDRRINLFDLDVRFSVSAFALMFISGVVVQLYRYRYVATSAERQQTKWVVFAFAVSATGISIYIGSALVIPALQTPGIEHILYHIIGVPLFAWSIILIPIALGFSILRYRLWDIDIIIRRTLIYGVLTANLVVVYMAIIILLQHAFRILTGQSSDLAIIISTLVIATLFNPLRKRIQNSIDRRFYRHKYDAQTILAEFAATVRDETDLQKLTEHLIKVVNETMQPTHVNLWLKATEDHRSKTDEKLPSSVIRPRSFP